MTLHNPRRIQRESTRWQDASPAPAPPPTERKPTSQRVESEHEDAGRSTTGTPSPRVSFHQNVAGTGEEAVPGSGLKAPGPALTKPPTALAVQWPMNGMWTAQCPLCRSTICVTPDVPKVHCGETFTPVRSGVPDGVRFQ